MKKRILYIVWAYLYALCAGLGHIAQPNGVLAVAMTILSIVFFVPGGILLADALRAKDNKTLVQLRWISALSLGLTLALLVANVLSTLGSELLGSVLYELLILLSVPMVCSRYWVLSLFLWSCLLFATFAARKKQ